MPNLSRLLSPMVFALAATSATAGDDTMKMQTFLDNSIRPWAGDPMIVAAVAAQNGETAGYDQARIDELDATWRAEVGSADATLVEGVVSNAVSALLREKVGEMGGQITEVIVMDARGLNVAVSNVTSDYWQGDEEKHAMTYGVGPDAVHFGEIEFDESSQRYQAQISFTLVDPDTGSPIGAMTVGVDAESIL